MIFTFYSFKGGVGRSMALANIARWYCDHGLDVLMVDWDLEAPGLEAFFEPTAGDGEGSVSPSERRPSEGSASLGEKQRPSARDRPGVIDMLLEYKTVHPLLPLAAEHGVGMGRVVSDAGDVAESYEFSEAPPRQMATWTPGEPLTILREHLSPIKGMLHCVSPAKKNDHGTLWLLPAGLRAGAHFADYAAAVQSFDWADFYQSYHGQAYFNWLREQFKTVADVTLIDARTGVTEMGGVCARRLADVVVTFCAPNEQNLEGVRRMVRSFVRKDVEEVREAPLQVVVVPSRVDPQDSQQYQQFQKEFQRALAYVRNPLPSGHFFWDLEIPYFTKYSYKEELAIGQVEGVGKKLGDAYRTLAVHLAVLAPEGSALRRKCARDVQERFPELVPVVAVAYAGESNRQAAEQLRTRITELKISVWQDIGDIESQDSQQLTRVLPHLRHVVIALSEDTIGAEALRKLCHETRQRGVWAHLICPTWVASSGQEQAVPLPPWIRRDQIHGADIGDRLATLLATRTPARRVPHMAPSTTRGVVMRSDGVTLKQILLSPDPATRVIALWGIGGSGKTTLAAAICDDEEVRACFDGGVLWATLGPHPDMAARLHEMIVAQGDESVAPPSRTDSTPNSLKASAQLGDLLERLVWLGGDRRTLLVLDDVGAGDPITPILNRCRYWTILLTTRDRAVAAALDARLIPLGEMTREEAHALLTDGIGELSASDEQAVETIRQMTLSLPLSLSLARSMLRSLPGADQSVSARMAALTNVLRTQGPFAADRPTATRGISSGSQAPDRSCSLAMTVADCVRRLPPQFQIYLAWTARRGGSSLEELQSQFRLSPNEGTAFARRLGDHALAQFDDSGRLRVHPLALAYFAQTSESKPSVSDDVLDILRGKSVPITEMLDLAIRLRQESRFGLARRLLEKAHRDPGIGMLGADKQLKLAQQRALCTYKDPELPALERLDRALEILELDAGLKSTTNPETLGLAGAIHKRKWEVDGQKQHLEDALAFYLRGSRAARPESPDYDFGYTAINASFLLDLLADQEEASPAVDGSQAAEGPAARRLQARRIREQLRATLPLMLEGPQQWVRRQWWFYATLAEACFGLQRYDEARDWIAQGRPFSFVPQWELESTARQLASLARLSVHVAGPGSDKTSEEATAVLRDLLDGDEQALRRTLLGKVGLALSGGGFRASLFHIGVLARLAELDVLRSVEVLSCVSGGSIIGAHYYLEVRHLLQSKPDHEITREDYITIVKRIADEFLAGIQTNIRTSVAAELRTSLRMILDANYSRTERLGELYEERLFKRVPDSEGGQPRYLNDLYTHPRGDASFDPKTHNWRRAAKVPILVLNATTLNTGHNWQFTASFMGEPPSRIDPRVDGNERLRRMYYHEAPDGYRQIRLGRAVAASACVPGLFEPLVFRDLYPDRVVRLVDGGVHDNQGVAALLEQDCTVLLVSDASGQMQTSSDPSAALLGVPLRANAILQARLRLAQFQELDARRRSGLVRGLMFIHLKKDLDVDPINWVACEDPVEASDEARPAARRGVLTPYGIRKDVQEKLSAIRTDLDSFSDLEAYALMVSGYRMTEYEFRQCITGFPEPEGARPIWPFLAVEEEMRRVQGVESKFQRLMSVLEIASRSAFKIWTITPRWRFLFASVGLVLLLLLVYLLLSHGYGLERFWALAATVVAAPVAWLLSRIMLSGFAFRCGLYGLSTFPAWLHIRLIDPHYLAAGRVAQTVADQSKLQKTSPLG